MNDNPVPPADYYGAVRGQIEHEDTLISQRLNWFLMSQSFLFTAYAIVVSNSAPRAPAELRLDGRERTFDVRPLVVSGHVLLLIQHEVVEGFLEKPT